MLYSLSDTSMGKGTGKLEMRGWLTNQETRELRKLLASKSWTPSAEEPLDGGCQDCAKHLLRQVVVGMFYCPCPE